MRGEVQKKMIDDTAKQKAKILAQKRSLSIFS